MRRDTAAWLQLHPQWPIAFDPFKVDDFGAVQHADIAGLAQGPDQALENGANRCRLQALLHGAFAQSPQPPPRGISIATWCALQQSFIDELPNDTMHGLFG